MDYKIYKKGKFKIVEINGNLEINDPKVRELDKEVLKLTYNGEKFFIFDLKGISYLDSSGISIFVDVIQYVRKNDGEIFFIISNPDIQKIISIVGLDQLVKVYSSLEELEKEYEL